MTQLSTGSSPGVYGDPKPPLVECGESNWTGGYCRRLTRTRCPYCFRLTCGAHRREHAMQGSNPLPVCRWFSISVRWGIGYRWPVDWELIREGVGRELQRQVDLDARASDRAGQMCTVEVG